MLRFYRTVTFLAILFTSAQPALAIGNSKDKPKIISLAPHITELIYAAGGGDYLVGVSAYSDYPEAAKQITVVGDAFRIDLEQLMLLKADAVFYWQDNTSNTVLQQLQKQDLNLVPVKISTLDDISQSLIMIADKLNLPRPAEADTIKNKFNALQQTQRPKRSVFIQISEQPIYTVSRHHWMSEAAGLCGLQNIYSRLPSAAATVTQESVIVRNPDVIIRMKAPDANSALQKWTQINAIKHQQIVVLDPDTFSRPTPRLVQAVTSLCQQVDQFPVLSDDADSN